MKTQKFYLLSILLEHREYETVDKHALFTDLSTALRAKEAEIEENRLYLTDGRVIEDLPTVYQMTDADGNSLTIVVEEIQPQ